MLLCLKLKVIAIITVDSLSAPVNSECPAGRPWVPTPQSLASPGQESNPQPADQGRLGEVPKWETQAAVSSDQWGSEVCCVHLYVFQLLHSGLWLRSLLPGGTQLVSPDSSVSLANFSFPSTTPTASECALIVWKATQRQPEVHPC